MCMDDNVKFRNYIGIITIIPFNIHDIFIQFFQSFQV